MLLRQTIRILSVSILTLLCSAGAWAAPASTSRPTVRIEIILSQRALNIYAGDQVIATFPVAIGMLDHPTPPGDFAIEKVIWNPTWTPPSDREWARGATARGPGDRNSPMRVAKIPFDPPWYYIHGTNRPESVGSLASHGCVRMKPGDVRQLGEILMREDGQLDNRRLVDQILGTAQTRVVTLNQPVPVEIRMGDENVYPGIVWQLSK